MRRARAQRGHRVVGAGLADALAAVAARQRGVSPPGVTARVGDAAVSVRFAEAVGAALGVARASKLALSDAGRGGERQ